MAEGFVFTATLRVEWPVKVRVPKDGGRYAEQQFTALFQILEDEQTRVMDFQTLDLALLDAALVGAKGIKTPEGEDLPWGDDVKRGLIQLPHTRLALVNAYNEATAGRRTKN